MLTLSGQPASLAIGCEFPIVIPVEGKTIVEFRECGVQIDCLPKLTSHDTIRLEIRNEISSLDFAHHTVVKGWTVPGIIRRCIETTVELESGETLVLGGIESHADFTPARCLSHLAHWCNGSISFGAGLASSLTPSCFTGVSLATALNVLVSQPKDMVIIVAANRCDPLESCEDSPESKIKLADAEDAEDEADAEEPHRPAILLTPAEPSLDCESNCTRPHAHLAHVLTDECQPYRNTLRGGANMDAGLAGRILMSDSVKACQACREACCDDPNTCDEDNDCCRRECTPAGNKCQQVSCDDDAYCCDREVESFIHQVLQAQMQYLESMMRARLEHERQLLEARAGAESALGKQQVQHAEHVLNLRSEHLAEIYQIKQEFWGSIHEQALRVQAVEHERELSALRQQHTEQLQSERIASLEAEIRSLRSHRGLFETERVAHSPDAVHQSRSAPRRIPVEMPLQVEDLASGRVRYAPLPPKPDNVVLYQPRDVVERVEFSTPPISTGQTMWNELECLRIEVSRLRVLVEDMLCFTPDFPPAPVPQPPASDCEN
jgi:hypothetical protein